MCEVRGHVRDDHGLAPLDHVAGGIVAPLPVEPVSDQLLSVRIPDASDDHESVSVELLHAGTPIGDHFAQLRQDQIDDLGQVQRAAERVGRGAERLGLLAS